ncbi:MAG: hypothetical protein RLZZ282_93 [Verrucomicrobiota bacterium]
MRSGPVTRRMLVGAPRGVALFLIVYLGCGVTSCRKDRGTPAWAAPSEGVAIAAESTNPAALALVVGSQEVEVVAGLRFIAYNVENWLTMDRYVNRKLMKSSPKPDSEKKAVIQLLVKHAPDVVGLCEIGEIKDLLEIQQSLKAGGLDLPHVHFMGGSDPVRHLGMLSRYPLRVAGPPVEREFQMNGQTFAMNRGILDAALVAHGKSYRLLGVHLKSKREIEDLDQEAMRIHEARLLRRHLDAIFKSDGAARLIVYGDFNDTRPSTAFKTVTGSYNHPSYLTAIPCRDTRGEAWTHYWALHDIYTRFDFVTVSSALKPDVDFRASRILDDPTWNDASDHRPLLAIFK